MKITKKLFSIIACVVLSASIVAAVITKADVPAELDKTKPYIEITSEPVKAGEIAKVTYSIGNNPGVWGIKLDFSYDKNLSLVKGETNEYGSFPKFDAGENFRNGMFSPLSSNELIYLYTNSMDNVVVTRKNGELFSIYFKVADDAKAGTYPIELINYNKDDCIINLQGDGVDFTFGKAFVTVVDDSAPATNTTQPTTQTPPSYTVKIDGAAVENNGSEFTFPVSTEKGFIAYTDTDGTKYYDAGSKITVDKDLEFTTVAIGAVTMLNGASIRLSERSGIRFETQVDTNKISALPKGAIVEKGTLITLKELATDKLTLDSTFKTVNVKYLSNEYRENGTFAGSIVGIKEKNIAKQFLGRGYVTVKFSDYSKTVYADYANGNIENNSRSVAFIANAYKTNSADLYNKLDPTYKDLVDKWASKN